ncbi:MAG: hypothetical protein ACI80V_003274 [Rhodothermales bacterium]|jgi:hypothetical protein
MTRFLPTRPFLLFLLAGLLVPAGAAAQSVVEGVVLAADTGTSLPSATVQVEDTYVGTVANADGRFAIEVASFPAVLVIRFVGYASERVELEGRQSAVLRIRLEPAPYQLSGLVVSSEDPAVAIMRQVIAHKQERRGRLERFKANAYNRFTIENDTGIVSIAEGLSEFMWDRERGSREVVTASRQTANLDFGEFMPAALFIENLYDDNIDVAGHNVMGVTHPEAIDNYDFRLESTTRQEDRDVFTISVRTWGKLSTGFEGVITVADEVFSLLTVELRPNDSFIFPPPIQFFDVTFKQQYLPYGDDQWLPADFRSEMDLKVGFQALLTFPVIRIRQSSRLSDYEINVDLPDSVFASERQISVDSVSVAADTLLDKSGVVVPLSLREAEAYAGIDSTQTLDRAFKPGGLLGRAAQISINADEENESRRRKGGKPSMLRRLNLSPSLWYNRVEGASPAISGQVGDKIRLRGRFGRATGLKENTWGYGASLKSSDVALDIGFDRRIQATYDSWTQSKLENSVGFLLGTPDYFDYYRSERIRARVEIDGSGWRPDVSVGVMREDASGVAQTTDYQLVRDEPVTVNPSVPDGRIGSFEFQASLGTRPDPFGIIGLNWAEAVVEVAQNGFLGSDYNFVRGQLLATFRLKTFFKRRLLPQTLDIHINLGASSGTLPQYRLLSVDGSTRASRPGSLRTLRGRPLVGDRSALIAWEHHFRTVPFERLGLRGLVKRGWGIIAFGGHGRTWLRAENSPAAAGGRVPNAWNPSVSTAWHHEVGLSLNGLFGILRLDVARRLDQPDWVVGFGIAKLF